MSTYLLLRNNKQAGPYTLDEIRAMALKAYDLVWVEGKSAAWRYPGEIEELKSFAPLVEEQPFDRFFKKPVQEEQPANLSKQTTTETEKNRYAPVASEQVAAPVAVNTNKAVYINLPAETRKEEKEEYVEKKQPVRERTILFEPIVNKEPAQKTFAQSIPASVIEPVGAEENFASPADQLKKLYAQKAARQQKKRAIDLRHLLKPVAIGFGVVALIGAGIFIGLSINNRGLNSTKDNTAKEQNGVSGQQTIPSRTIPAKSSAPANISDKNVENTISSSDAPANVPDEKVIAERKRIKAAKQKIADSLKALQAVSVKADSTAFIAERDAAKKTTEAQSERASIKNNIEDYVSLSASKFNVGTFGGISDLQLTVSNTSPFTLDLVVVEVQYIQSNKKIFKTENLYYRNVGPSAAIMEEAPKSSRGVKVKYRVTIISSKNQGISFTEL